MSNRKEPKRNKLWRLQRPLSTVTCHCRWCNFEPLIRIRALFPQRRESKLSFWWSSKTDKFRNSDFLVLLQESMSAFFIISSRETNSSREFPEFYCQSSAGRRSKVSRDLQESGVLEFCRSVSMNYPKEYPFTEGRQEVDKLAGIAGVPKSPPVLAHNRGVLRELNSNEADPSVSVYLML